MRWCRRVMADCSLLPGCFCHSLQLPEIHTNSCDNISQFSVDSITSLENKEPVFIAAGDIRSETSLHYPEFHSRWAGTHMMTMMME